jgi:hypothetical protein
MNAEPWIIDKIIYQEDDGTIYEIRLYIGDDNKPHIQPVILNGKPENLERDHKAIHQLLEKDLARISGNLQ